MKRNLSLVALAIAMSVTNAGVASADTAKDPSAKQADQTVAQIEPDGDNSDNPGHSPDYTAFPDLAGLQRLKTGGLRYSFGALPGGAPGFYTVAPEPFREGVTALYDPASGNIAYKTPDGLTTTFTAADEVPGQSTARARLFFKPNPAGGDFGGSLTTPVIYSIPLSYARFGTFYSTGPGLPLDGHAFVLGVDTLARDMPRTGSATYATVVGGSAYSAGSPVPLQLTDSTATFSANFATGGIATTINLIGRPVTGGAGIALDRLTGVGTIGGAKPGFLGDFTGTGTVRGGFSGAFFGPNAVEFAYNFLVGGTNAAGRQFSAIGGVAGSTAISPPPPPPPPVYIPFASLTGMQSFASAGVWYGTSTVPSGGFGFVIRGLEVLASGVAVEFDTATTAITFTAPNGLSTTFTAANNTFLSPTARSFSKPNPAGGTFNGNLTVPVVGGVALTYTRFASFSTSGPPTGFDAHAFVYGVTTVPSDVPTTGSATYTGGASGTVLLASGASNSMAGSTVTLAADFATGEIATLLNLVRTPAGGSPVPLDVLIGQGVIGAVKPGFAGTLFGSGNVIGNFAGAFFGPQASEFGFNFIVGGTTGAGLGFTAVGGAAGRKD